MFKPDEIEAMPLGLEKQFKTLENRVMKDVVRRIRANSEITRSADWQMHRLQELGMAKDEIKRYIQDALKLSDAEVEKLYSDAIKNGYIRDEKLYKVAGVQQIPFAENAPLRQLIATLEEQTKGELQNITRSLGFAVRQSDGALAFQPIADYYQKTLDSAMLDIATGVFDYNTVLKRVVREMTNSGLRTVDYASGWSNRAPVAARRAVMTGIGQIAASINEQTAESLGTDSFEVTWHTGARPSHQVWQGRVYTRDELVSVCGLGTGPGLCGWNCYHSYYPFIPGVSERTYTDEKLDRMNAEENTPKEFNGKSYTAYEALQRQRKLETTMRAQRQEIHLLGEGGANEDEIIAARCRYRVTSGEYTRFSKAMGLPQQRERVTVDGLGNIGVGKTKIDLTQKDYNDIINMKGKMSDVDVRKWYISHDKGIMEQVDTTLPLKEQAMQACKLRNKYKFQARELMADQEKRKYLDEERPINDFEFYYNKYSKMYNTEDEIYQAILDGSMRSNSKVNKSLGLEE